MLFRDLIERHDVSHPRAVSDMEKPASARPFSMLRLAGHSSL